MGDGEKRQCISDTCDLERDIKKIDGTCTTCAAYKYPNELNLECIACTPAEGEVILVDGTCEICPENTYVGPYLHECISDLCVAGEYLDTDGTIRSRMDLRRWIRWSSNGANG